MVKPKASARMDYTEFGVSDGQRAKSFYAAAFGWTFQDWGAEYIGFHDGARDAGGMRVEPPGEPPLPILFTDDIEGVRMQVIAAGGTILGPDHEFPGGKRFHCRDPFGNQLAVWTKA